MIYDRIKESIDVKMLLLNDEAIQQKINDVIQLIIYSYSKGGKVLFCGNGGSAADAQHLAAELSGRFYLDRKPLAAEALHVNTSYITAVANDFSYDLLYSRYVEGMGKPEDVLVGISTSGNSKNIIEAIKAAHKLGMKTIGLTGKDGGSLKDYCQILINVPSTNTPRIQEAHILIGHIICEQVEALIFGQH